MIREKKNKRNSEIKEPSQLIGYIKEEAERQTDRENANEHSFLLYFTTFLDKS